MTRINHKQPNSLTTNNDPEYSASVNDNSFVLDNLMLPGETEADIKAGCPGCTWGPPMTNHNESMVKDTDIELDDLGLLDDEPDGIKGGRDMEDGGGGIGGDWVINHNETALKDTGTQAEMLDDLAVENDTQIKGGDGTNVPPNPPRGGGQGGGGFINNHNETTISDSEDEVQLADLPVADAQAEDVNGGGIRWNHNETIVKDADVESFEDLMVKNDMQIKGGDGTVASPPTSGGGGGYLNNHNETTVCDREDEVQLADLKLPKEELNGIKGGDGGNSGRTGGADWIMNHNETALKETDTQAEMLDDLAVESDLQIKGGDSSTATTRPTGGGGYVNNHNETTVNDEEGEIQLTDLPVADEQAEDVTGGGFRWNHNETIVEDADVETFDDLAVENDMQIKGGDGTDIPPRPPGGGFVNNHNETTVCDREDEVQLADLRLPDEKLDRIKGGDGVCHGTTVLAWARVDGVSASR